MKRSLFFMLISLPILLLSCVGEDLKNSPVTLNVREAPFSVAFDEEKDFQLGISTNLDTNESIQLIWESLDPSLIQITPDQQIKPVASREDIGKTVLISGSAFNKSDISINEETSAISVNSGASPVAVLTNPIEILIARVTLNIGAKNNLENSGVDVRENVISGFEEMFEITEFVTSVDINDENIPPLQTRFIDFQRSRRDGLVVWTSSDTSILEVDKDGILTPIAKGKATITATIPNEFTDGNTAKTDQKEIEVSDETVVVVVEPDPDPTPTIIPTGTFAGLTGYSAGGSFQIIEETGMPSVIQLSDDFSAAGVPDLVIYLSNSIRTNAGALFISDDIITRGAQTFDIPAGANQLDYEYVFLYCRAFNAPVGFAKIER